MDVEMGEREIAANRKNGVDTEIGLGLQEVQEVVKEDHSGGDRGKVGLDSKGGHVQEDGEGAVMDEVLTPSSSEDAFEPMNDGNGVMKDVKLDVQVVGEVEANREVEADKEEVTGEVEEGKIHVETKQH